MQKRTVYVYLDVYLTYLTSRAWRRVLSGLPLLEVLAWTARRANLSILKEINPECSLEGQILKLRLQYFGHLMRRLLGKDRDAGKV